MSKRRRVPPFVRLGDQDYVVVGWDNPDFQRRSGPLILRPLLLKERRVYERLLADAYSEAFTRTEGVAAAKRKKGGS